VTSGFKSTSKTTGCKTVMERLIDYHKFPGSNHEYTTMMGLHV